jgi:bifunctional non-homologous end joining protein LigD
MSSENEALPVFVVQKHEARNLHYDFRLEIGGALKSWAVPKGPSTDPADKRLAMETEDHAMDHADFEGVIPGGEYGAGAVIVWDRGSFRNLRAGTSLEASYNEGKLEFSLNGEKLKGGFALFRTDGKRWLLRKKKDAYAVTGRNLLLERPESVVSGRTIEEMG